MERNICKPKKVSYLMPSYNHRKYIKKAIDSVLNQTYTDIELLVCDDGSTDGSDIFLERYAKEKKFVYIKNKTNLGVSKTLSRLADMAEGEFIGLLASDDWIEPAKVEKQVKYMLEHDLDEVISPMYEYYEQSRRRKFIYRKKLAESVRHNKYLLHMYRNGEMELLQGALFRASAVKAIQFHPGYKADDVLFQLRFLQAGYKAGYLDEPLAYYRVHSSNTHHDYVRCMQELLFPVIRDFYPARYQPGLFAIAYYKTAVALGNRGCMKESIKYQVKSVAACPGLHRMYGFLKLDIKAVLRKASAFIRR